MRSPSKKETVTYKVVLDSPNQIRGVFYSNRTNRQLAVLNSLRSRPGVRLSVPIEGMGGWHVILPSTKSAYRVAERETTRWGRIYNRTVFMALAFLIHKLH